MATHFRPLGEWTVLLSHYSVGKEWQADQDLLSSLGGKPPNFPYSHRCGPGGVSPGIAEDDARALSACKQAGSFGNVKRNESFVVDGAKHCVAERVLAVV